MRHGGYGLIAIEPVRSTVLGLYLSRHRNMLVAESFLRSLIEIYARHTVYSDDGGTWYHEACSSIGLKHRLHTSSEKSLIERAIQYFKDRTEHFDDYYPCIDSAVMIYRMYNTNGWLGLFVIMRNAMIANIS
jgi:putative transposase